MLPRRCDHFGVGTLLKGTSALLWKCPRLRNGWINCLVKYTKVYGSEGNRSVKKTSFLRDSVSNLNLPAPKTPATPWNQSEGSSGGSAPLTSSVGDGEGPDGSDTFNNKWWRHSADSTSGAHTYKFVGFWCRFSVWSADGRKKLIKHVNN